jgi:SAM-dependent methyltransferase
MTHVSTREFYEAGYSLTDPAEAERMGRWRAIGARSKAAHVRALLDHAGERPGTIVEIGCGDGSLLVELATMAEAVDGFELSANAAGYARQRGVARRVEAFDGEHVPAADGEYDVAVLSHVLEHVPDPSALLREAARVARSVVLEVPLESNLSARRGSKREGSAEIGHLQALDRDAVRSIVAAAGLSVREELLDPLPLEVHTFFAASSGDRARSTAKAAARRAVFSVSPRLAERTFTLHFACLAQ